VRWDQAVAKHGPALEEFVRQKNGREQPEKFRFLFSAEEMGEAEAEGAQEEREYYQ